MKITKLKNTRNNQNEERFVFEIEMIYFVKLEILKKSSFRSMNCLTLE